MSNKGKSPFVLFPKKQLWHTSALSGRMTVASILIASTVFSSALYTFLSFDVHQVSADDVSTSITVLNTPPEWTVNAEESTESSATIPTNAGSVITWTATGTDSSNDNYFLLICKTGSAPTAVASGPPTCNGGISNMWARSATTTSGAQASAATTTREYFPFNAESNDWYAWICDANSSLPRCNVTATQGSGSTASPFVVNHPPYFNLIVNDGPEDPNGTVTWTATAFDTDVLGSADTVTLIVCKSNDFTASNFCGAGGTWATSTAAASNPATTTPVAQIAQDKTYNAYVYLYDSHGLVATSSRHGFNSSYDVNNVAPVVTASSITLVDTDASGVLTLLNAGDITPGYKVQFEITDSNSCLNSSSGAEFTSATTSAYRSGVTQASCDTGGEFNVNNCYPSVSSFTTFSCSQDGGSCSGATDPSATWTCTFSLWYNADPTDASTPYTAQTWLASVQATDDDGAISAFTETTGGGNDLASFLAFNVSSTSIPYGSLEPGATSTLATSTDLIALGNTGLDQDLYGDTMCTTWTTADSCDSNGISGTNDIVVSNQKFATSTMSWEAAGATALTSSSSPSDLAIHVPKTLTTSTPNTRYVYWGIRVPNTITAAGAYSGQNTITGKKSAAAFW
jgi:hypothetical protein